MKIGRLFDLKNVGKPGGEGTSGFIEMTGSGSNGRTLATPGATVANSEIHGYSRVEKGGIQPSLPKEVGECDKDIHCLFHLTHVSVGRQLREGTCFFNNS
jgi:hypothetical protein